MNISDEIVKRLSELYPTKTFKHVLKIDEISFEPWIMIAVNDRTTTYGYFPKVADQFANPQEFVDGFIANQGKNLGAL